MSTLSQNKDKFKRTHRQTFLFNDYEMQAFTKYCRKYRVKNKAKFMRETIVTAILKKFDQDYPSLFDPPETYETDDKTKK